MATTKNGIYYPNDGTKPADILSDMKKMAESIDENIQDNKYDPTTSNKDITDLKKAVNDIKKEQTTQNDNIEKNTAEITALQEENADLRAQIPKGQATGTEITLNGSSNLELTDFSIAINNSAHLVVSNKNLLFFSKISRNGITFDKNRITIIDPTGYLYAGKTLVGGNKFLSGKRVIFTAISNGTISTGALDFTIHTNKTQYKFQKKHTVGTYNDDIKSEAWQFANDEYITSIFVYTTGATCNLTIDVQVSIIDAEFIEHQGAEFQITSSNKDEIIKQIIENGTYQGVTHFYTTDETHANMDLEYYQSLDTSLNKYKEQLPKGQAEGTEISLNDSSNLELTNFNIAVNNSAHLVVSNKNLLFFSKISRNGITFDKNRITIIDPTGYLYAGKTLVGGNKFLSGKRVIFTAISNGTISTGALDFTIHTNKTQYKFQKKHTVGTYNDDKKSETWQFANDEYITSIFIYTTGATCNLTIDVQVSIVDAAFVEHEGAEFDITTDNLLAVVNQIKRNGTYKNVTHFYTTDETHPSINLEYYKDLETLFNNIQIQLLNQIGGN